MKKITKLVAWYMTTGNSRGKKGTEQQERRTVQTNNSWNFIGVEGLGFSD